MVGELIGKLIPGLPDPEVCEEQVINLNGPSPPVIRH
jgi:hypothetical protein